MNCLDVRNLTVFYGNFKALNDVSFSVPRGSITAFVGINGAGKTTTFSAIAGFIRIAGGYVIINNMNLKEFRRKGGMIGLFPQDVNFFEDRSVLSQMLFLGLLSGVPKQNLMEEVLSILDKTKLIDKKDLYPASLSRGMKVRLGIAQALLGRPELIFLDEPAAGLDPIRKREFYDLIISLKEDTSFLISSHQLSELEEICDRVVMIDKGKVIREQRMKDILSEGREMVYRVNDPEKISALLQEKLPEFTFTLNDESLIILPPDHINESETVNSIVIPEIFASGGKILEIKINSSLKNSFLQSVKK